MRTGKEREDPEATQIVSKRRLEAVGGAPESPEEAPEPELAPRRRLRVVVYSAVVSLASAAGLALSISLAWYLQPGQELAALSEGLRRYALLNTLFTMMLAGAAGGALSNLVELLRLGRRRSGLPERLEVPLYLRPASGAVMGVAVFFLLQFFVAVLSVGATTQGWALLHGRLAYVAVSFVVGFAVRDLERVREIAASLVRRS
ncbi:MAG: hypothetical protein OES32_07735 [Acidobacteriota bacterium]|nr:hypothetical protein [Acidobacteriota bacterium]MDH3523464.1 hypothetical protein [Acidobacteriota bacterium]